MTKCNVASTYTYDAWGRTVSMARDGQGASYTYGYGDKLTNVDADWEVPVEYDYNGLGQRVSRGHEDITTNYYWSGWSVVNEYFDDDSDNDIHTWAKTYVGGLGERAYSGGAYTYYFTDHLGSVEALYDESKDRVGGIGYTPYGTPTFAEGTADGVTHRYTGHDWDALTGQYFAPYRYYSRGMHRWLTRDPMGMVDGPNVYGYVGGNAAGAADSKGTRIIFFPLPPFPFPFPIPLPNPFPKKPEPRPSGPPESNCCKKGLDEARANDPEFDGRNDKYKHCTVGCHISKQSNYYTASVCAAGKEFVDIFTPGDASFDDYMASVLGAHLGEHYSGVSCEKMCARFFER